MIIQHNMAAANTNRQLGITGGNLSKSTEKLSSGYRINRSADDAAGLSISEKMRGQVRGLERGSENAQDGIALIQVAEGAMNEQHAILQRARELCVQAANDTNATVDRTAIQEELKALESEFSRINSETDYNSMKLLDGKFTGKNLQVGANKDQGIGLEVNAGSFTSVNGSVANYSTATAAIKSIDDNIVTLSTNRSKLGALQNRLEYSIRNADNTAENLQSAESRIRDVNMAKEMAKYSKDSILQQAGQSMLAQANQSTQGVLSLLR